MPGSRTSTRFMARVLARRDENWKKMQQYILDEQERFRLTGPDGARIYGFDSRSTPGSSATASSSAARSRSTASRSPKANAPRPRPTGSSASGAATSAQKQREKERAGEEAKADAAAEPAPPDPDAAPATPSSVEDMARASLEPRFVSAAYFLRFKFDPGHYALAGRERLNDRDVLHIEYYPSKLFNEGRTRPNRRVRDETTEIEEKMNKVSLVTTLDRSERASDPAIHVRQHRHGFLPGRSLVRVDDLNARR